MFCTTSATQPGYWCRVCLFHAFFCPSPTPCGQFQPQKGPETAQQLHTHICHSPSRLAPIPRYPISPLPKGKAGHCSKGQRRLCGGLWYERLALPCCIRSTRRVTKINQLCQPDLAAALIRFCQAEGESTKSRSHVGGEMPLWRTS